MIRLLSKNRKIKKKNKKWPYQCAVFKKIVLLCPYEKMFIVPCKMVLLTKLTKQDPKNGSKNVEVVSWYCYY